MMIDVLFSVASSTHRNSATTRGQKQSIIFIDLDDYSYVLLLLRIS